MRMYKLALLLTAFLVIPAGTLLAAPANAALHALPQDSTRQELVVTVVSVDMAHKAILVEESPGSVMISSGTVFDNDVQLDKLKAGTKVKVVGVLTPDGKLQASEVHAAK